MAGKKGRRSSASVTSYYSNYKSSNLEEKNRARKLIRHLKAHPNDKQAEEAMKRKPVHRKKPEGKKPIVKLVGIQQVSEGVYSYIADREYKPGHPTLALAKKGYSFDQAKKLKNSAIFSEEFKVIYASYVA